jgi:hypothetical protein
MDLIVKELRLAGSPPPCIAVTGASSHLVATLEFLLAPYLVVERDTSSGEWLEALATIHMLRATEENHKPDGHEGYSLRAHSEASTHVEIAASDDMALARGVLAFARSVFKVLAIQQGGTNLHAGCVVSGDDAVLILGERLAGKTTAIIAAVSSGGLRFLGNDQVVLMRDGEVPRVLGYPALVKVRLSSASVLRSVPWHLSLWTQADDARPGAAFQTAVFAPGTLYPAVGSSVTAQARLRAVVFYQQAEDPSQLTCADAGSRAYALWSDTAVLPLNVAYRPNLLALTFASLRKDEPVSSQLSGWPEGTRAFTVACGVQRLADLGGLIADISRKVVSRGSGLRS